MKKLEHIDKVSISNIGLIPPRTYLKWLIERYRKTVSKRIVTYHQIDTE